MEGERERIKVLEVHSACSAPCAVGTLDKCKTRGIFLKEVWECSKDIGRENIERSAAQGFCCQEAYPSLPLGGQNRLWPYLASPSIPD